MPAILFDPNSFASGGGGELVGRMVANRQFLDAIAADETVPELGCYALNSAHCETFRHLAAPRLAPGKTIIEVLFGDVAGLTRAGALHRQDPAMAGHLWQRRYSGQRDYSVTGVIHTISSRDMMAAIGDLALAPFQPWDALICTSQAGRAAIQTMLEGWSDYLAQRLGAAPGKADLSIQLPVIPLGVDVAALEALHEGGNARRQVREQLGIAERDVAALCVGRITFRRKSNPVPMFIALQRAQQAARKPLHFILAGRVEEADEEKVILAAAAQFCPDVRVHIVGGKQTFRNGAIWYAGDIFLSLSDNIQETFGLTPVEAMAAGLPAVVSDWDGYRDTVRHGIDGFLIPTAMPAPPAGVDMAARYQEVNDFRHYYGSVAMSTAVDIEACAQSLTSLIVDPQLRQRMGENARQRARALFDWPVVIKQYHHLWQSLAEIRADADMAVPVAPGEPPIPRCDDPFRVFAGYASMTIDASSMIAADPAAARLSPEVLKANIMSRFGQERRADWPVLAQIVEQLRRQGPTAAGELERETGLAPDTFYRSLVWLQKFGMVRFADS